MELEDFIGFAYLAGLYPNILSKNEIEAVFNESKNISIHKDNKLSFT